jgi:hypothetical protein
LIDPNSLVTLDVSIELSSLTRSCGEGRAADATPSHLLVIARIPIWPTWPEAFLRAFGVWLAHSID